jgi:hypothetical protein
LTTDSVSGFEKRLCNLLSQIDILEKGSTGVGGGGAGGKRDKKQRFARQNQKGDGVLDIE